MKYKNLDFVKFLITLREFYLVDWKISLRKGIKNKYIEYI